MFPTFGPSKDTAAPTHCLILRKAKGLSRRMGGTLRNKRPILRDGPDGPPQDEGVARRGFSLYSAAPLNVIRALA
ncbi:hypothetical protein ACSSV1_003514 [Labrenzia sp. MBR-25]